MRIDKIASSKITVAVDDRRVACLLQSCVLRILFILFYLVICIILEGPERRLATSWSLSQAGPVFALRRLKPIAENY